MKFNKKRNKVLCSWLDPDDEEQKFCYRVLVKPKRKKMTEEDRRIKNYIRSLDKKKKKKKADEEELT